jgi:hypothetical protein
MKALLSLVLLLATVFAFANVRQVNPDAEKSAGSEVIKMRVNSAKVQCEGYNGNTLCFEVQKGAAIGTDNWEVLREPIEGFSYEEGYIYDVTVKIESVENPQPNQPRHKNIIMDIMAKTPVQ